MRRSARTSHFIDDAARTAFLARYDQALRRWPTYERLHLAGRFGTTGVLACGSAHRPPLVLLHGRYTPSPSWTPVIRELVRSYCVYAIDTIGEPGLSENDGAPLRAAGDYLAWLSETLDQLDLTTAHLAGHSFGGWVAARFAVSHPHRLSSLTLLDPAQVFARFRLTWLLRCIPPYLSPTRGNVARFLEWAGLPGDDETAGLATLGMTSFRLRAPEALPLSAAQLRSLRVPTQQLIAGRSVVHSPKRARSRAARLNPAVTTHVVAGAAHFVARDQPERVVRDLRTFITST